VHSTGDGGYEPVPTSTAFRTIPLSEELAGLDRDLRFHPSAVRRPAALSRAQVEAFNRDGYLKRIPIFSVDEMRGHRAYFDALLERVLAEGGSSYSISTAHLNYGKVYDLLTHPRIVRCVRDLLGEDVIGWGSHYFCKLPGDGKVVNWHQDASYWPLTPSKTATVWLAVDDSDVGNGCMRFLPGSHRFGHLTYRLTEEADDAVLNQVVDNVQQFGDPVNVELLAGEISIHSDLLLHSSEPNQSARRRCGLTLRYCSADVRAGLGWNAKGVCVSGADSSGHWANPPRPGQD
jgi:non-heme Fe2+,alpha-ketoglutarate-dependent halogenase